MMKKILYFLIIITFIQNVSALNNVNISIDSGNIEICLSDRNMLNMTCNSTTYLILNGESDHFLYFTSKPLYENINRDTTDKWDWLKTEILGGFNLGIDMGYWFIPLIIYIGGGALAVYSIYAFIVFAFNKFS